LIQEYKCKFKVDSKYKCLQGTNLISAEQRDRTDRQSNKAVLGMTELFVCAG